MGAVGYSHAEEVLGRLTLRAVDNSEPETLIPRILNSTVLILRRSSHNTASRFNLDSGRGKLEASSLGVEVALPICRHFGLRYNFFSEHHPQARRGRGLVSNVYGLGSRIQENGWAGCEIVQHNKGGLDASLFAIRGRNVERPSARMSAASRHSENNFQAARERHQSGTHSTTKHTLQAVM